MSGMRKKKTKKEPALPASAEAVLRSATAAADRRAAVEESLELPVEVVREVEPSGRLLVAREIDPEAWTAEPTAHRRRHRSLEAADRVLSSVVWMQAVGEHARSGNTCVHVSATGVDWTPLEDPAKLWRCDVCGLTWRAGGGA